MMTICGHFVILVDIELFIFQLQTMLKVIFILVDCNSVSKTDIGFSACFPYEEYDGPCVFDDQCKDNLFCGYKNCPVGFDDKDNCCTKNELLKSPQFPINYPYFTEKNWNLIAPAGYIIKLQFHFFHVRIIVESKAI